VLFNSYEFIFAFLPLTLCGFFLLGSRSRALALGWLIAASLFFYAWWRPINVLIIAPSILVNYVLARSLLRLGRDPARAGTARAVLALGVVFNLCFLGYFKYVNFFAATLNDVTGSNFVLTQVVLPLGISFITFQKIAFLVDVHGRRIESFTLRDYALFVLFFPQLIAGPIVHFREMMPQFHRAACRIDRTDIAVGLTLFVFGLFKKVVLADGIAAYVTPIYESAGGGAQVSLLPAWIAALGFTLQIYFDFSGYSDMALGLGRFFGVRLPANFDSPLKATNIIDFWLRWHMTLTRFLTAYVYNPLVLKLTRRRLAAGRPALGGRSPSAEAFIVLLVAPTLLTMFLSGLWHGAGYLFILWGVVHGGYLVANHAWRFFGAPLLKDRPRLARLTAPAGFLLTFFAVVFAMVLFRSVNATAAREVLEGMLGMNGVGLPPSIHEQLAAVAGMFRGLVFASSEMSAQDLFLALAWVAVLVAVALVMPNTLQMLEKYQPALVASRAVAANGSIARLTTWEPTLIWAVGVAACAAAAIMRLGGQSEFLYWQF
jgi:D-alanyl-lipoteichoic acid acyltransferase DltB (MBOAT superfamily)